MALMDKMKAQAAQLAQKAQEAGKAGQSKIGDMQEKRRADGLLRELGAAVYAQRSGTASSDNASDIERIVAELTKLETESGPIDTTGVATSEADGPSETETPPEGGFKL